MKLANRARAAKKYVRNFGDRGHAVREMPCLLAAAGGCEGAIEAAHAVARGMGGARGDRRQLVPLCRHHHRASGSMGAVTFAARYRIDLVHEAVAIAAALDARGLP